MLTFNVDNKVIRISEKDDFFSLQLMNTSLNLKNYQWTNFFEANNNENYFLNSTMHICNRECRVKNS